MSVEISGSDLYVAGTYSESAANQVFAGPFTTDGITDNQSGPGLDSGFVVQLRGGRNRYRVIAIVAGSGGLAIATGGVASIVGGSPNYNRLTGSSVVLDQAFSAGPSVWGYPQQQVIDLGDFQATGTFDGFATAGNVPCTYRLYGGGQLGSILFIPNCVRLDETFTFGDPASGIPGAISDPTYGTAFTVTCPINNCIEYFFAFHGSTTGSSYGGGSRFPVINVDTVPMSGGGGDVNFYGDEWQISGDHAGGFDVSVNAGDSLSQYYTEYYASWNGLSGHDPLSWFDDPASATIDRFWFSEGTFAIYGPPIMNTAHRAYQSDEDSNNESGTTNPSATFPENSGSFPFFNTVHRAHQSDEGTDS